MAVLTTPEERWWVVRAGEYVLGTLRGRDLELFERILQHDSAMQREVFLWERQLAGLTETTRTQVPATTVWPAIAARIREIQQQADSAVAAPVPVPELGPAVAQPVPAEARKNPAQVPGSTRPFSLLWPGIAAITTAASLLLGILVMQQAPAPAASGFSIDGVSVVETDADGTARFIVETDYENQQVRIVAVAPPSIDKTQNLQLWQALPPGQEGVRPVARLSTTAGSVQSFDVSTLIENSELFGISVEPVGAPTDGGPTGPVIAHGEFIKTRSADGP